jgi:MFS family permease
VTDTPARPLHRRLLPEHPITRALTWQSMLWAFGTGIFITGNAVFFTHIVGLTPAQVGLGMTLAGVVTFLLALPMGRLADLVERRRLWASSSVLMGLLYLTYPWVHGFATFVLVLTLIEVVGSAGGSAWHAYTLDVFAPSERVQAMAYNRAFLNIGFTLGALAGGVALALDSDPVVRALPVLTAVVLAANAAFVLRLPAPPVHTPVADEVGESVEQATRGALRNRGYLATAFLDGVLTNNQVLLNVVIPLWLVAKTDAPRWVLAWLFGTNTVMAVLLQVRAARGVDTLSSGLRATRRSAVCFVLSCGIILLTHDTVGWVTILLMWVGHITVTGAELYESAGAWAFESILTDPERRGEYSGAAQLGHTLGTVWAPAAFTFLAMEWAPWGWAFIAGTVIAGTLAMPYAVRAAYAYLPAHVRTTSMAEG